MTLSLSTKTVLLLILFEMLLTMVCPQDYCKASTRGKNFIIAFPQSYGNRQSLVLVDLHILIVSFHDGVTEVKINSSFKLPDDTYFLQTVIIQPRSFERVSIPGELELFGTEKSFKTVEITADFEVTVDSIHLERYTSDGFLAIPTANLGTQYVVTSYVGSFSIDGTFFTVIGSQNDTIVSVQLRSEVFYDNKQYNPSDTLILKLSKYEVIQILSTNDSTGSIINSTKPIGVMSGHSCTNNPRSSCDILLEQNIPVRDWGTKHFYSTTGRQNGTSIYRMIAFFNDTSFNVNGANITLNSGNFSEFYLLGNGLIVTSKPASMIQILLEINGVTIEPSIIHVPTEEQFVSMLGFVTLNQSSVASEEFTNFVNVIVKSDEKSSLRLSGNQINLTNASLLSFVVDQSKIMSSDYDLLVIQLPSEEAVYYITQELINSSPISAIVYGYARDISYGYVAALSLFPACTEITPTEPEITSEITTPTTSTPNTTTTSTPTITTTSTPNTTTTSTPNTTTTSTPTSTTTSTPSTTTTSTPTTTTASTPTTSTTISTSTITTTSSSIGITPKITSPGMNITQTLDGTDTAIESIECVATGIPAPVIYWTRNFLTKFIDSPILQINITDLSTDGVFYCVAENSAGRDVVSVNYQLSLTTEVIKNELDEINNGIDNVESISDEKSGQTAARVIVIIDAANNNSDINSGNRSRILESAVMLTQMIIEKTNGTFSNETTESITGLLSSIVDGSSTIQESEQVAVTQEQREQSTVATIPSALAMTLNTLERFSQRLIEELANSGLNSVQIVESRLITIVVQNVSLENSEDGETKTEIELPLKNSDDVKYSVMITLSTNLAVILSNNGKSLVIATSIVKRIEVKESDSSQPTQGSDILTVALAGKSGIIELTENVKFSFDVYSNQPSESICVFLKGTSWVSDGLSTDQKTTNLTNCESSHLTSFAVFVTPYKNSKSYIESIVLSAISYLFVGISFIFLLISLILFLMAGKAFFKVEANILYFNYCLSMLLATGLFVFGIQVGTYNIVLCQIIAFLLHYSWLSVFTWTLCIGMLIMYKIVINVLSTKKIYKYLIIFGWGFPLIIPVITIAVAQDQYVDVSSHCFLNITGGVIWAFIGPILIMILINAVFLIIALIQMIRTQSSTQNNETRNIVKNALITGLVLTPVLGLPWLILIFNVTIQHSVLEWLFIIVNGSMGFVFFLVVVLRNKEILTRFKRNKQTAFSNAHQSSKRTAPSSPTPSSFTSNRFKKTNTLERHLVKESEIQSASIEQSEICKSPYETMDYQNNICEIGNFDAATPGKADENMTGYDNPFCTSDALDDAPVSHNLSNKEIVTEVISNPMYMQSPSGGYTNELYSTVGDVIESDTQVLFNPDEGET